MTDNHAPVESGQKAWQSIEITTFAQIAEWLAAVEAGSWSWTKNTRCKYVDLKLDTRRGGYSILDRDGKPVTFAYLCWQYPDPIPQEPQP